MPSSFPFTFAKLREQFEIGLEHNYRVLNCAQYVDWKRGANSDSAKVLVNRVDIDVSVKKAQRLADIFRDLKITASFFVRLHANEYNPFSFENYRILKTIRDQGHEIGYHSEVVDEAAIWSEKAADCLRRDIDIINRMLGVRVKGVASHGGMTGLNNADFWQGSKPSDYGLLYEAYDRQPEFNLFYESLYVSDSEWTQWKCYRKGAIVEGDRRSLGEHLAGEYPIVYSLIHPVTYYDRHSYE